MESKRRIELMQHAEPAVQEQAAALLDELTRPLTPKEIDAQLAPYYTRAKRREILKALYFLQPIVLLAPRHDKAAKSGWVREGDGTALPTGGGAGSSARTGAS